MRPKGGIDVELTGAAGIELCPLETSEVADYLEASSGGPIGAARWAPVIAAFAASRQPPAAQALTTPLMATLARAVYNPPPGENVAVVSLDPVELLDLRRFPAKEDVERHLYDRFIPACYRTHPDPKHPSRKYRWTADQAERWLTFLARYLTYDRQGATDLEWWELPNAVPKHFAGLALGVLLGLAAAIGYPFVGFGIGVSLGLIVGLVVRRYYRAGNVGITRGLAGGLLGGLGAGVVALTILGPGVRDNRVGAFLAGGLGVGIAVAPLAKLVPSFAAGFAGEIIVTSYEHAPAFQAARMNVGSAFHLLNGFGIGLAAFLTVELIGRRTPAREVRWSPVWFACGVGCGLIIGFVVWLQVGCWVAGLAAGFAATIAGGLTGTVGEAVATNLTQAADPTAVLRRDRSTFLASSLGLGLALGLSTGIAVAISPGATGQANGFRFGLEIVVVVGIGFGFIQAAWGQFAMTQWWLALTHRLPWRLMTFLRDACVNRGVLRQFGAVYQFRHIELQRRLARSTHHESKVTVS